MLTPRTVYQRSERSALGRPTSWFRKQTRRGLNEVFLQFDVDNQGLLTYAKIKAMYMRYSPAAEPEAFARFCDQHELLDFPRFVRLVEHEQRRGRFLDFEVASLSSDLMHESEQLKRAHDIDRLLARVDPRQATPKAPVEELPKPLREPFKGIRMSAFFAGDLGKSLAAAVEEHKKQQALDAETDERPPLSLPPVAPPQHIDSKPTSRRHRASPPVAVVEQEPEEDDEQSTQQPPPSITHQRRRRRRKRRKGRHKTKNRKRGSLPPVQEDGPPHTN